MSTEVITERSRTVAALESFASDLVNDRSFDYVVPVERKGTALVRAALGASDETKWRRILSSSAVNSISAPDRRLRVLVLDDSVWSGRSLRAAVDAVRSALPQAEIVTAAFVTHIASVPDVDIAYYRRVDEECYREYRDAVVEYLQTKGNLLLDTEHVEVTARLDCSGQDFYSALAGWGETIMFASGSRVNCTVLRRPDQVGGALLGVMPDYTDMSNAICKLRVVSRPNERNTHSLVPICYPNLNLHPETQYRNPNMPWTAAVGWDQERPTSRVFQAVGLSLSVELVIDAMMFLSEALPDKVQFDFAADGVDHLLATFPEADLAQVRGRLGRITTKRGRKTKRGVVDDPGLEILERLAQDVLDLCYDRLCYETGFVRRISMVEILELVHKTGQPAARISAALDLLIDSARILPEVNYERSGSTTRVIRVFVPEGEVVKRKLVRRALGLGRGLERSVS